MSGKVKKIEILKKIISSWDWNIVTNFIFFRWNFFQSYHKNFCGLYRHNQGIWNVYLIYNFTSVKKWWPYDTPMNWYVRKSEKNEILKKWNPNWGWNILTNLIFWGETFSKNAPTNFSVGFTDKFKVFGRSA